MIRTRSRHNRKRSRSRSSGDAAPPLQKSAERSPFFQANKLPKKQGAPSIQRSVQHVGVTSTEQNIDLLDPTTAPKGKTTAPGYTEAFVNTKNLKDLYSSDPAALKNALFPLPTYQSDLTSCFNFGQSIQVDLSHTIRMIKPSPWSASLSKDIIAKILGGKVPEGSNCFAEASHDTFLVTLVGAPDDVSFQDLVLTSEEEHVAIDKALLERFVMSYEEDVSNLPSQITTALPCTWQLGLTLKRNQYMNAFMEELDQYHSLLDHAFGPHGYRFKVTNTPDCSGINIRMRSPGIKAPMPSSKKWKPQ